MKSSARRVQDYLHEHGLGLEVVQLPASTRTAQEAALAVGCDISQIAKSLVFQDEDRGEAVLVIASGGNRVDLHKVASATGHRLGRADADFVREKTGYAIGGVPPVAHQQNMVTLLDRELENQPLIWAAAGTPNALFSLKPRELQDLTGGEWVDLAE